MNREGSQGSKLVSRHRTRTLNRIDLAFLWPTSPTSSMAKPACMNNTIYLFVVNGVSGGEGNMCTLGWVQRTVHSGVGFADSCSCPGMTMLHGHGQTGRTSMRLG